MNLNKPNWQLYINMIINKQFNLSFVLSKKMELLVNWNLKHSLIPETQVS